MSVKEGVMPSWLTDTLKWGGSAVAIVFAAALIWVKQSAPDAEGAPSAAPVEVYWVLLAVGVIAAIFGFAVASAQRRA
jgi:hypothetical protein